MRHDAPDPAPPRPSAPGGRPGRGTRPMHPERPCMNCGDPSTGRYCPSCGQRKVDIRVSVRALAMDVLEDQFLLDRRLPRTLHALLLRPGHLTVEYVNGRIVRYIQPLRLYLVTSLLFFLLLSFLSLQLVRRAVDGGTRDDVVVEGPFDAALADLEQELADTTLTGEQRDRLLRRQAAIGRRWREARLDSLDQRETELRSALGAFTGVVEDESIPGGVRQALQSNRSLIERRLEVTIAQREALAQDTVELGQETAEPDEVDRPLREVLGWSQSAPDVKLRNATLDSLVTGQLRRLGGMPPREAAETVAGTFFSYVPTMMFLLLPVFAAVLKLLYIRRRRYYAEHFVFLLHVHSVVFILATVMLVLRNQLPLWVDVVLGLWIVVYIYLALMRVYGQGWIKTFVKYWILGWTYFWVLTMSIPLAVLATLLLF